ncbi:MAG TPA: pirin family protein [Albitalea sp.]|uniref:pirin family protein n=1 Tax=Piscinibacter sp. TaxID=1903157 RepID=UPI002ED4C15C
MSVLNAIPSPDVAARVRAVVYRTMGHAHGPVTRLMSPSDMGKMLKPFVFLDHIDFSGPSLDSFSGFGLHPHSGIVTITWLFEGEVRYEDNLGRRGVIRPGWVEWMHAGGGAWHGGSLGDSNRLRGFQLWIALPPEAELGEAFSQYLAPQALSTHGPVTVLLGEHGSAKGLIEAPSPINYFSVKLKAGQAWHFQPPQGHQVAWAAVSKGRLRSSVSIEAGEFVAFEEGEGAIGFEAESDTDFVIGSAAKHPHDLVLGHYSVHTSADALHQGEARIRQIGQRLRREGRL